MTSKTPYTYTVLRYVHDIATGEFLNVGVALFAPEPRFVNAVCRTNFARLKSDSARRHATSSRCAHPPVR